MKNKGVILIIRAAIVFTAIFISGMQAIAGDLTADLAGTKWTWPENGWFVLNADGTVTVSWDNQQKRLWKVLDAARIEIVMPLDANNKFIRFNPDRTEGVNEKTLVFYKRIVNEPKPEEKIAKATPSPMESATPAPISAEVQQSASELVKLHHGSLVFVTGKEGAGSGFIASMGGTNYLVTNAHVSAGINGPAFKTLDGAVVQGGLPSIAVGEDIFRMQLPAGGVPLEIMQGVDENAAIGDNVVVLGNAEGEGVINTIIGKIVGVGPNLVEVDAPFVPGNSGSPIVHLKTGKVIGVATYTVTRKYNVTTKEKMKDPVVRRFGYRIDSVKQWQPVNWQTYYAQAAMMKSVSALTGDLYDFFRDLEENKNHVTPGRHSNPVLKTRIDQWMADKGRHLSESDVKWADANFISFLKVACRQDTAATQRYLTYDYFQRDLADEQQEREQMAKAFEEIIQGIEE
ncbi:MAG: serine protease [Chthoniobacteraceae bacterium]